MLRDKLELVVKHRSWEMACCRGKELFPTAFIEYLTTDGAGEKAKEERLLAEFQKLEDFLAEHKADYFGGSDVCSSEARPSCTPQIR